MFDLVFSPSFTLLPFYLSLFLFRSHTHFYLIFFSRYITRAEFGCSVDIWDDTIAIGAEMADYGSQDKTDWYGRPDDHRYNARGAVYIFIFVNGTWYEQTRLQPDDKQASDRFGHDIALEHDQLVVGANGDELKARTTWNFETGNLVGWTQTGKAFLHQPTMGDNTNARMVYGRIISTGFSYVSDLNYRDRDKTQR